MLAILDVVIGLIFIYLLLSLVCTAMGEFWAGFARRRARTLTVGIEQLLREGPKPAREGDGSAIDVVKEFYGHDLIQTISRRTTRGVRKPDYIPARTFALALLDIVKPADGKSIDLGAFAADIDRALIPASLKKNLKIILREAGGDLEKFRAGVETWFNNAMDRVSGWYKRRTQYWILLFAAIVAVFTNADTIAVTRALSTDSALRAAVVAQAEQLAKLPADSVIMPGDTLTPDSVIERNQRRIEARIQQLEGIGVPLGWKEGGKPVGMGAWWKAASGAERWSKIIGLLLTALALSLGAPFWFDMLNKVINVRNAGRAPDERPKAPEGQTQEMRDSRAAR